MFEEVNFHSLIIGNKYYITGIDLDIIYYRGIFEGCIFNSAKFHSIELVYPLFHFYDDYKVFHSYPKRYYYKFVSKKHEIQQNMETRAINKILCRIIGDEHFKWQN